MTVISIIVGSTRPARFSEKPARWIHDELGKRPNIQPRILDLREFDLPLFDQPVPPAMPGRAPYTNEHVKRWTEAIQSSDGFVFVTPEYNYGPSAVLKNAIDWVYAEWNRKPAAFVSYGGMGGARGVEHLRSISVELQIAPLRHAVYIPMPVLMTHFQGGDVTPGLAELKSQADKMIEDLLWWTAALKNARAA